MGEEAQPTAVCCVLVALGTWGDFLPVFATAAHASLLLSSAGSREPPSGTPQQEKKGGRDVQNGAPPFRCIIVATHECLVKQLLREASVRGLKVYGHQCLPSGSESAAACDRNSEASAATAAPGCAAPAEYPDAVLQCEGGEEHPLASIGEGLPLWLLPLPSPPVRRGPNDAFDTKDAALLVPLLQGRAQLLISPGKGGGKHTEATASADVAASEFSFEKQQQQKQRWRLRPGVVALGLFAAVYAHAAAAAETPYLLLQPSPYARRAPPDFFGRLFAQHPELRPLLQSTEQQQQQQQEVQQQQQHEETEKADDIEGWALSHASRLVSKADIE